VSLGKHDNLLTGRDAGWQMGSLAEQAADQIKNPELHEAV